MANQFVYPTSDVSLATWTDTVGGTTNIYLDIAESLPDDADYVQEPNNKSDTYEFHLGDPDTVTSDADHHVRYRYQKSAAGGNDRDLTVALFQGGTQIATVTHTAISEVLTQGVLSLTTGEAANITDYTDLRVRLTGGGTTSGPGGNRRGIYVTQVNLQLPVADPDDRDWFGDGVQFAELNDREYFVEGVQLNETLEAVPAPPAGGPSLLPLLGVG